MSEDAAESDVAIAWTAGALWALADQGNTVDSFLRDAVEAHNPHRVTPSGATP